MRITLQGSDIIRGGRKIGRLYQQPGHDVWGVFLDERYIGRFFRRPGNDRFSIIGHSVFATMRKAVEKLITESMNRRLKIVRRIPVC